MSLSLGQTMSCPDLGCSDQNLPAVTGARAGSAELPPDVPRAKASSTAAPPALTVSVFPLAATPVLHPDSTTRHLKSGVITSGTDPHSPRVTGASLGQTPAASDQPNKLEQPGIGYSRAGKKRGENTLEEIAAYTPFWLWHYAGLTEAVLEQPEVQNLLAGVMFADVSGFTALTGALAEGAKEEAGSTMGGSEQLTRIINKYFNNMIAVIVRYGGDVLKFAGDAMLVMFPASPTGEPGASVDLVAATRRAALCALALQKECGAYPATDRVTLKLHIGVGAGPLNLFLVGGAYRRWECVAAGQPINQVGGAEGCAEPGDVCLSSEAWSLVGAHAKGDHVKDGFMLVHRLASMEDSELDPPSPMRPVVKEMIPMLSLFLPGAVKEQLLGGSGGTGAWLNELRRVVTLFINVRLRESVVAGPPQVARTIRSQEALAPKSVG